MVLVTPYDARSKRLKKILRLVLLLSLGTIFALLYWLVVALLTFRRGNRVSLSPENASGDSRLRDTILMAGSAVQSSQLSDSLVGERAEVKGYMGSLNVGDESQIAAE